MLVLWSFFIYMFGASEFLYKVMTLVGCVVFLGWVCYDTNNMFKRFGPGDEMTCAIKLYLDMINLVTYIMRALRLFGGQKVRPGIQTTF